LITKSLPIPGRVKEFFQALSDLSVRIDHELLQILEAAK